MANTRYLHYTTQSVGIYSVTTCIKTYETVMGSEVSPLKDVRNTATIQHTSQQQVFTHYEAFHQKRRTTSCL